MSCVSTCASIQYLISFYTITTLISLGGKDNEYCWVCKALLAEKEVIYENSLPPLLSQKKELRRCDAFLMSACVCLCVYVGGGRGNTSPSHTHTYSTPLQTKLHLYIILARGRIKNFSGQPQQSLRSKVLKNGCSEKFTKIIGKHLGIFGLFTPCKIANLLGKNSVINFFLNLGKCLLFNGTPVIKYP